MKIAFIADFVTGKQAGIEGFIKTVATAGVRLYFVFCMSKAPKNFLL
jgi:hypothetical protein